MLFYLYKTCLKNGRVSYESMRILVVKIYGEKDMKKFDKEYATQWLDEVEWLRKNNIRYTFVKTDENNITTYKYTKTSELFSSLAIFYAQK